MFKKFLVGVVAAGVVLGVTACSSNVNVADRSSSSMHEGVSRLSHEDVMFVEGMIVHHEQALEMAKIVLDGSSNVEVQKLAGRIIDAQFNEVSMLQSWVSGSGMDMDMDMGMVSVADVEALRGLSGVALDDAFLKLMITHHEGAVSMSEDILKVSSNGRVRSYAESVVEGQGAEIVFMRSLMSE